MAAHFVRGRRASRGGRRCARTVLGRTPGERSEPAAPERQRREAAPARVARGRPREARLRVTSSGHRPDSPRTVVRSALTSSARPGSNHFVIQLTAPMMAKPIIFGSPGRKRPLSMPCWTISRRPRSKRSRLAMMRRCSAGESACRSSVSAVPCSSSSMRCTNARMRRRSFSSGRARAGLHVEHQREQHVERVVVAGVENLFLVAEVVVEIPFRHFERRGDLVDARAVISAAPERGRRALENFDSPVGAVGGSSPPLLLSVISRFERSFKLSVNSRRGADSGSDSCRVLSKRRPTSTSTGS